MKNHLMFHKNLILIMMMLMLSACSMLKGSTHSGTATKTMLTAQTTIVSIAIAIDEACTMGALAQKDCDRAADLYGRSKRTYDLAENSLELAIMADSPEQWKNYEMFHNNFYKLYMAIMNIAIEYGLMGDK